MNKNSRSVPFTLPLSVSFSVSGFFSKVTDALPVNSEMARILSFQV